MRIRDSSADDMETITRIYECHVLHGTASFEETAPTQEVMRARREAIVSKGLPYLVAGDDAGIFGFAYAGPYRTRSAYRYTLEDTVYVDPKHLAQGVGSQLLAEIINRSKDWGARQLIAVIGDTENIASIRLHEKMGFRRVGILQGVGFKFGRWLDSVILQRSL
jgi:L-amino acid N-acyltransferase YncA